MSTIKSSPPMIADELRRQADFFLDLDDLREQFGRQDNANHHEPSQDMSADEY